MTISGRLTLLTLAGVVAVAGLSWLARSARAPVAKTDTVVVRQIQQAEAVRDTVRVMVPRWQTRIDTLNVSDTVEVKVFLRSLDTVFVNCLRCADRIDSLVHVIRQLRDSLDRCRQSEHRAKAQRPWVALGGLATGVLACRAG